jgi:hypothetical protein
LTETKKKFMITFEYRHLLGAGYTEKQAKAMLGRMGFSEEDVGKYAHGKSLMEKVKTETVTGRLGGAIGMWQVGTKRVAKTGLALIHEGEEIKPKSMARHEYTHSVNLGGVTIHLHSSGSERLDAYKIKRELERLYKMESRRLS